MTSIRTRRRLPELAALCYRAAIVSPSGLELPLFDAGGTLVGIDYAFAAEGLEELLTSLDETAK